MKARFNSRNKAKFEETRVEGGRSRRWWLQLFKRPEVECCLEVVPTIAIYPLELMDTEQQSIDGNLRGVLEVLTEALGCSSEYLIEGRFLVAGDQLLLDRIGFIQLLRDGDAHREDFMFVITLLGPLHT